MFRLPVVLLAFGAIFGFASAFHHGWHEHEYRQEAFERHIADVCTDAALRARPHDAR